MALNLNFAAYGRNYGTVTDAAILESQVEPEIQNYLSSLGFDGSAVDIAPTGGVTIHCVSSTVGPCFLRFSKVRWRSFTGAHSLLGAFDITTTTEALIEDPCFRPSTYAP